MQKVQLIAAANPAPILVTVVTGFLGAGKTTLLNHILHDDHGRRIAVVANDFGSINIDAELISDVGEGIVSLANGCICCDIRTDLISAVLKLADRHDRPDHIVIESSGVTDPASVVSAFMDPKIRRHVLLDGVITVVDAEQATTLVEEEAKLARAQVATGDLIVLNKIDLVDVPQLAEVQAWVKENRPGAQMFVATDCRVPIEILLGIQANDPAQEASQSIYEVHDHDALSATHAENRRHHHEPLALGT